MWILWVVLTNMNCLSIIAYYPAIVRRHPLLCGSAVVAISRSWPSPCVFFDASPYRYRWRDGRCLLEHYNPRCSPTCKGLNSRACIYIAMTFLRAWSPFHVVCGLSKGIVVEWILLRQLFLKIYQRVHSNDVSIHTEIVLQNVASVQDRMYDLCSTKCSDAYNGKNEASVYRYSWLAHSFMHKQDDSDRDEVEQFADDAGRNRSY